MQRTVFILPFLLLVLHFVATGQSIDSLQTLEAVHIVSERDNYLVGSKIETIDSARMNSLSGESLAEVFNRYLPVYVKQNAGGISTIRFRGTSPDHTAILFNGININSLTLGHSNLSNIPMFLFDEVKVQYGGSSSLYGSDAIGGSIHLNNKPLWNQGLRVGVQQDVASFGSYFTGFKLAYSNERFQYSIKIFHQQKENDFPFLNIAVKDFEKNVFVKDTMKNSALSNNGILHELYYKISNNMISYIKLWNEGSWYQSQPNMSANYYGSSFDEIKNVNLRLLSGLKYLKGSHKIATDFGYIYDYQLYNRNFDEIISMNSLIANFNYCNSNFFKGNLNVGSNINRIIPEVYAYQEIIQENRLDFFSSYKRELRTRVNCALNLRESMVSNYQNRFSPSFGIDYLIFNSKEYLFSCKSSISRSYKTPTFNDRYWYPNGNPDILSESGMSYEFGSELKQNKGANTIQVNITGFFMKVDNWIQWVNYDMWRPRNIKKVQNRGIEFSVKSKAKMSKSKLVSGLNYSFTKSTELENYEFINVTIGKQLVYTPKHLANAYVGIQSVKWDWMLNASYTGQRYDLNYKELEGYFLLNMAIGRKLKLKNMTFLLNAKVNNIINKAYQNQSFYAMPGRNFGISIKYFINQLRQRKNENN